MRNGVRAGFLQPLQFFRVVNLNETRTRKSHVIFSRFNSYFYGNNNVTFVQLMLFDDLLYFVKKDEKFKYFQRFSGVSFSSQKSGIFVSSC